MLSLHQISLRIDDKILFNNLSLDLKPSSITYIKGKNGSGKTSLLRSIAGVQQLTGGKITVNNAEISTLPKPYCLYIGHKTGLKLELTAYENLQFWASSYDSLETLHAAIIYFGLEDILDRKCYHLSAGNQKRLAIAKLMLCQTDIWLLDEIEANLDADNREFLRNLIKTKASNGGIIIMSSHHDASIQPSITIDLEDYKE